MVVDTDILIDHFHGNAHATGETLYTRNLRHYPMSEIVVEAPYERGR